MDTAPEIHCPLVTPFDDDGAVDEDALESLVNHLLSAGVDGLVALGTTGEFPTMTDDERRTVVSTVAAAAPDDAPVFAGVGGTAVETVRARIRDAEAAGADAVLVPPPYYGGQAEADGNEAFFRSVLADAPLPAYLYNIPSGAGQEVQPDVVASLADHDAVAGLKDSSGDVAAVGEALRRTPDEFTVYQGIDAVIVPSVALGTDGSISALAHLYPVAIGEAAAAAVDGDLERARAIQFDTLAPAFQACDEHGFAPAVKAVLHEHGILPSDALRPPKESLSDDERRDLLDSLPELERSNGD